MEEGGSAAKKQDFTEEMSEMGFEGYVGVFQEDSETVFAKLLRQNIMIYSGDCK